MGSCDSSIFPPADCSNCSDRGNGSYERTGWFVAKRFNNQWTVLTSSCGNGHIPKKNMSGPFVEGQCVRFNCFDASSSSN